MDLDRRRVVMILIVLAIAVPLLVEGYTLARLVGSHLGGDGTPTPTAPGDTTQTATKVGAGDELLAETGRTETVTTATLNSDSGAWTLTLTVSVDNTGDDPYELRLGDVTTGQGETVSPSTTGSATTDSIQPGAQSTVTAQWELSTGDQPESVAVTALEYRDGGSVILVDRNVRLASFPVDQ
jgi:hypothetical protein